MEMSREQANPRLISATRTVLIELAEIFESYPEAVIVGGFVPYLLIPHSIEAHEGTVDIDVVLDPTYHSEDRELTLHDLLERQLFQQDTLRPFRYTKTSFVDGEPYQVLIELLGGGDPSPNGLVRYPSEDVYLSVIKGMEVAYIDPIAVAIPDNEDRKVTVASMPAFLTMKAIALDRRDALKKAKDAYDIVYCLRNYPNGLDEIAKQFSEEKGNPLITHGIRLLTKMFDSVDALGPTAYAQRAVSSEDAALLKREAVERIRRLLLKIELG
jgi:hypothetical protein